MLKTTHTHTQGDKVSGNGSGAARNACASDLHLQEVREETDELRSSKLQTLQVQSKEAQQLMGQEGVVEEFSRKAAKDQLPHTLTVHSCHLACTHSDSQSNINTRVGGCAIHKAESCQKIVL